MRTCGRHIKNRTPETELIRQVRVAVCGELPTACEHLHKLGVINIHSYSDAVNIGRISDYHLILVYAPQGEGLFNTFCRDGRDSIPLRLLNEPCCHSALLELEIKIHRIARSLAPPVVESAENALGTPYNVEA